MIFPTLGSVSFGYRGALSPYAGMSIEHQWFHTNTVSSTLQLELHTLCVKTLCSDPDRAPWCVERGGVPPIQQQHVRAPPGEAI